METPQELLKHAIDDLQRAQTLVNVLRTAFPNGVHEQLDGVSQRISASLMRLADLEEALPKREVP